MSACTPAQPRSCHLGAGTGSPELWAFCSSIMEGIPESFVSSPGSWSSDVNNPYWRYQRYRGLCEEDCQTGCVALCRQTGVCACQEHTCVGGLVFLAGSACVSPLTVCLAFKPRVPGLP